MLAIPVPVALVYSAVGPGENAEAVDVIVAPRSFVGGMISLLNLKIPMYFCLIHFSCLACTSPSSCCRPAIVPIRTHPAGR